MLFKDYHMDQIRSGSKTVTRREWERQQAVPGNVYIASTEMFTSHEEADCYIRVLDVYQQPLGEMSDEDARAEGDYETLEEFRAGYEKVYGEDTWDPEKVVWVVEFEYLEHLYVKSQIEAHRREDRPPVEFDPSRDRIFP